MNRLALLSCLLLVAISQLAASRPASAQLAPEIGYIHPSGGQAGTTVDVVLGGYDWTPDMQLFVLDPKVKLELAGKPSPVLISEPPYWFGAKAHGPAWPLAREFPAKMTIPADVPSGLIRWQAANANGPSPYGFFHVTRYPQIVEDQKRIAPQMLPALPVTVAGQIRRIEEIDRYEFTVPKSGPVTIELIAQRLKSPLNAMLQVRDVDGKLILDAADTEGHDLCLTMQAVGGVRYTLSMHDLDFAGDRSYFYRLELSPGPHVQAAYPAAGKKGETRRVEFVGPGLATGGPQIETIAKDLAFPAVAGPFQYVLETPGGPAKPFRLHATELAEQVEAAGATTATLAIPAAITGSLETRFGTDRYTVAMTKGETWQIAAQAEAYLDQLDLQLTLLGPDGKQLMAADDEPGTTDARLLFSPTADGNYTIVVADRSGKSGTRSANYHLTVEKPREDFTLTILPQLAISLGNPPGTTPPAVATGNTAATTKPAPPAPVTGKLPVKITRIGGYKGVVQIALAGLPEGLSPAKELTIPGDKSDLVIELAIAPNAPATASLVTLTATGGPSPPPAPPVAKPGSTPAPAPPLPAQPAGPPIVHDARVLIATTLVPRIKITPEGLDDVRKVNRGSTYLAPLLIERLNGYQGPIVLEMTAKQQRHRQGLTSDEFTVGANVIRAEYPIFVPEWMETTKTSRMILNGAVQVPDARGTMRTLLQRMELRIGVLPEGAMMKLGHVGGEFNMAPGGTLNVNLHLFRALSLGEAARIELAPDDENQGFTAVPQTIPLGQDTATFPVVVKPDCRLGEREVKIRATALKDGKWPVISETTLSITIAK